MNQKNENNLMLTIGLGLVGSALGLLVLDFKNLKSKYFSFDDLVRTSKTTLQEHPEQFNPSKAIISNANYLVKNLIDPLNELQAFGVSSWFRSAFVNDKVGGVAGSKHLTAEGVDIIPKIMFDSFLDILETSGLPFTKAINEGDHIHITLVKGLETNRQIIR